jgi:ecotin
MKTVFALLVLLFGVSITMADEQYDQWKKAYPKAKEGQSRHVLHLPKEANEDLMKVELIVGKVMETDGVNHVSLGGTIKEQDVPGWGFPQYIVTIAEGGAISTLIGVPPGKPKVKKFVTLGGGPQLFRYNSKLPVVVYAPEGYDVRYRFWKADAESKSIDPEK